MPPPVPQPLLGSLPIRPAHQALPIRRSLPVATAAVARTIVIPPEAPSYLPPPMPPQSSIHTPPKRERGHLPVPRKVFRNDRVLNRKLHPDYVGKTYPLPQGWQGRGGREESSAFSLADTQNAPRPPHKTLVTRWKARHTDFRRANMRDGVQALAKRQERREKEAAESALRRRARAISFIERSAEDESERLTRPSVAAAVLDVTVKEDPMRFERAEQSRRATEAMYERHRVSRKDALTQLYVNAKHFIVTEKELEATVMELFTNEYWERHPGVAPADDRNVWGTGNRPDLGSTQMASRFRVTQQMDDRKKQATVGVNRMERVAEQLTGGKFVPEA